MLRSPSPAFGLLVALLLLTGCAATGQPATPQTGDPKASTPSPAATGESPAGLGANAPASTADPGESFQSSYLEFQALARKRVDAMQAQIEAQVSGKGSGGAADTTDETESPSPQAPYEQFQAYGTRRAEVVAEAFFKGRYNRSRARLPENIEKWRSEPNIDNPGPDLANFPNSAFTLPAGHAYVELAPFSYYGTSRSTPAQYNTEFLLRYGLTDDIELRLFGNGVAWQGGNHSTWGFSPIAFDTKINILVEKPDYFLPALGIEVYLQTQWLGSAPFDSGTQPSVSFNFDQSLPFDIDFEYNLGATRTQQTPGKNEWEFVFQWALQRDLFHKDISAFIHGYYNAMTLPRLPNPSIPIGNVSQSAVGAGLIWTLNDRVAMWAQSAAGTTKDSPPLISTIGLAVAF